MIAKKKRNKKDTKINKYRKILFNLYYYYSKVFSYTVSLIFHTKTLIYYTASPKIPVNKRNKGACIYIKKKTCISMDIFWTDKNLSSQGSIKDQKETKTQDPVLQSQEIVIIKAKDVKSNKKRIKEKEKE